MAVLVLALAAPWYVRNISLYGTFSGTQESAAQKITRVNKAQKMQGLGGKTPAERTVAEDIGLISSEQLAEMSDDQYLELKSNPQTARMLEKRLEELG